MRVLFSSTRGSGHIQPLLPYARALLARGHEVLVAGPAELSDTLRDAGCTHAPFDHPGDDVLAPIWARLRDASGEEALLIAVGEIFGRATANAALPKLQDTIRSWQPDLIVRDSVEFASLAAAEAAGVPHASVQVHVGCVEERMLPVVVQPIDELRRRAGIASDGGASLRAEPIFTAFPASLDEPSGATAQPTPFRVRMPLDEPSSAAPPGAPTDRTAPFLYITFGTIAGSSPTVRAVYRTTLDAVADVPVRALLTTGRGFDASTLGSVPENVHVEAWVPQRDVLPRATAVVCHGGSGTVLGALAAAVPMVIVPLFADQPDNARRVAAVGAGLAVPTPDASTLRAAIARVLIDAELRQGARRMADEMATLPTLDAAVEALIELTAR